MAAGRWSHRLLFAVVLWFQLEFIYLALVIIIIIISLI